MRIDYHDLSEKDFERLVVCICVELLGPGVVPFCTGPDGGRDARFEGRAANLPNSTSPYNGKFVAQAKHSEDPVAKYTDTEFSGDAESSVISGELTGVKRLVDNGELDIYLMFANRKMSALAEGPIRERIKAATGAKIVELFGIERMNLLLRRFSEILKTFGHEPMHLPLLVTCDDLAEVILAISSQNGDFERAFRLDQLQRVSFKSKNDTNGLSDDLAAYIRKEYVPHFGDVKKFLAKPENSQIVERYEAAAEQFQEQLILHRRDYATFDDVLIRLRNLLFYRDSDLSKNRKLTNLVVYYMYWNCDVGSEVEADATTE